MPKQSQTRTKPSVEMLGDPRLLPYLRGTSAKVLNAAGCHDRFGLDVEEEAKDIAGTALRLAFERFESFRGDSSLSTWVSRIAINMSINRVGQLERRGQLSRAFSLDGWAQDTQDGDGPGPSDPPDSRFDPSVIVADKLEQTSIVRALRDIRPDYRDLILLRARNDMPYKEMAKVLGTTEIAVRAKLHRARVLLKELAHIP